MCLDRKQLDLTFKVLMRISDYEVSIRKAEEGMESDERQSCERLVAEYYVLRTALVGISIRIPHSSLTAI